MPNPFALTDEALASVADEAGLTVAQARAALGAFERSPRRRNRDTAIAARAMTSLLSRFSTDVADAARRVRDEIRDMDDAAIETFVNDAD